MTDLGSSVDRVLSIFGTARDGSPSFPPAELFSEGWMLRLLMDAHIEGLGGLPIAEYPDTRWYSEARLLSPFQPVRRGDPLGEGVTHADGVVGSFRIRDATTAGLEVVDPRQFVVIEAKMGSRLAPGTSRVPWFNQAARNVAAMAWALHRGALPPDLFQSLAFVVVAPGGRINSEPTFRHYTTKGSLWTNVANRIELYREIDSSRYALLTQFREVGFDPFLDHLDIHLLSWEEAIAGVGDQGVRDSILAFYEKCLLYSVADKSWN